MEHTKPLNRNAECAVLALVQLDSSRIVEVAAAIEPAEFADDCNRTIYAVLLRLHSVSKPIDVTRLVGELRDAGRYGMQSDDSAAMLVDLYQLYPLAGHLNYYVTSVAEMARRRRMIV